MSLVLVVLMAFVVSAAPADASLRDNKLLDELLSNLVF
jgi:hypothetical protein